MKRILCLLIAFVVVIPFSMSAASGGSYIEMVAGNVKVKGNAVGVLTTTPLSNIYQIGMKVPFTFDDALASGLKLELINKGATVKILNPAGVEQVMAPYVEAFRQFSAKEQIAIDAANGFKSGMSNSKADISAGIQLLEKLLDSNELSGEIDRVNNYSNFYKKVLDLWGIKKLITVTRINQFSVIVKGYDLDSASATLTFQYEVRGTADTWKKIPQWKDDWKIVGEYGYTVEEPSDIKYEQSYKRTVELIKRVSEFLR
jgi:hypothetical protein